MLIARDVNAIDTFWGVQHALAKKLVISPFTHSQSLVGCHTKSYSRSLTVLPLTSVEITIKVEEVNAGLWDINFSPDLETFYKTEIDSEDDFDLPAGIRKLFEEDD